MHLQRWVASLQRSDVFATVGCTAAPRRGAHRAPVYPRCYNNPSSGRAERHRGDRKTAISNLRQGREALTGETPDLPPRGRGDRPVGGGRSKRRSARPRGFGGDFEFLPLKSPRNPITPIETSRVSTLHPGLYKRLRAGTQPPKTSLFEGGGPPAGGGRSFRRRKELKKTLPNFICFIYIICPTHIRHMMFFSLFFEILRPFSADAALKKALSRQPFSVK